MENFCDVKDVLDLHRHLTSAEDLTKGIIIRQDKKCSSKKSHVKSNKITKRPEGMTREVFALLYNDKNDLPSLFPADTSLGYKNAKADLSIKSVRQWKWMPFTNSARSDNAVFYHWRRACDEGKEYTFARFNKNVQIPNYTDYEYDIYLTCDSWTREETNHLLDLASRFDLRFGVMADRWDLTKFTKRSIEDLKERYYDICTTLTKIKTGPGLTSEMKNYFFDADYERKRKEQLERLYSRTKEQVEEEQMLMSELRKIEARKKERDRKTQDLQKLITAADCQTSVEIRKPGRAPKRKSVKSSRPRGECSPSEISGVKFHDQRDTTIYLRSQRMILPANLGQKKIKVIEQLLNDLNIELNQIPTEEICLQFNELRNDFLLFYELRAAMASCEFELQTLRHQYEAGNPGKTLVIPPMLYNPVVVLRKSAQLEINNLINDLNQLTHNKPYESE